MKKLVCHIVDKHKGDHIGIDQYIAERLGWKPEMGNRGMNPYKVAALRGVFDTNALENNMKPLISDDVINPTTEQLEEALKRFMNFRAGTMLRQSAALANSKKNSARAWANLKHVYSLHERRQTIHNISIIFSAEVDRLMKNNDDIDRESIVNGFRTIGGEIIGGPVAIFSSVYNALLERRQQIFNTINSYESVWERIEQRYNAALKPNAAHPEDRTMLDWAGAPTNAEEYKEYLEKKFNAFTRILENWNSLLPFVMKSLVKTEGVKLSIKKEFLSAASSDSYNANDIAAKWDMSEAVREGWQRNNDKESALGSIGQQVRRILAQIYEVESIPEFEEKNGVRKFVGIHSRPVFDEMGFYIYKDPIQVHQYLSEYFRGIRDINDLKSRLIKPGTDEARISWMQPLVDLVTSDDTQGKLVTQLFVDFKKNFQPYSIIFEDEKESYGWLKKLKTKVINRPKNLLKDRFILSLSKKGTYPVGVKLWGFTPVFEEGSKGGKVNWMRLAELRKKVLEWTHEENPQQAGVFNNLDMYKPVTPALLVDRRHDTAVMVDGKAERLTYDMKRTFLLEVFTSLGFDVTLDAIDDILNSNDIYKVRELLEQLFNPDGQLTGIIYAMGKDRSKLGRLADPNVSDEEKQKLIDTYNSSIRSFKQLYNIKFKANSGQEMRPVGEFIDKLLNIISDHQEGKRLESRARYMDNTLYSYVNPSFLGDRLETIESFVNENDHAGLLNFLKEEYLQDSFFVDDDYIASEGQRGEILNMWLAEMVKACNNTNKKLIDSVAAIFTYERDLGSATKEFEDFTSKEHAVDMLVHFFADEQVGKGYDGKGSRNINKKLSALYPIFVLGDAGVSKYIRAPRIVSSVRLDYNGHVLGEADAAETKKIVYSFDNDAKDRVVDQFYNVYLQEHRRMALDEAMAAPLYANGKEVKHPKGEFSFLTFLNPTSQEYMPEYALPIDPKTKKLTTDAYTVKKVIRKFLENATLNNLKRADGTVIPSFKQKLQDLGLLETVKGKNGRPAYRFLNSVISPENIDEKLSDFYWNTKLATTQQLQLMTVDPSFYQSTKDLQKRYKEIHAPGNVLDVFARDFNGNYYCPSQMETVAYFKDLKVNAEQDNPEFMESVLRTFAKPGVDVKAAIADGVLTPKSTPEEETIRKNKLIDLLGNDVFKKIYEPYMGNTLTDGQGYRTLRSYRSVMGMAGKWTREMEEAYNFINAIRREYTSKGLDIPEEAMRKIGNFALVLQPIGPYMFTHEKVPMKVQKTVKGVKQVDAAGHPIMVDVIRNVPVQHKYAEALIIPELMPKGSKLRDLGLWMDDHKVDLVGSDKIAKVGCFGQADLSNVNNNTDLITAMGTATVHSLPYRDYRIQTNVPEHINASQLFGTQVRKLIMAGLMMGKDYSFYLGGQTFNLSTDDGKTNTEVSLYGKNLLALYNSLICANIFDSYDRFAQNVEDIDLVSEMLQQSTIGSLRESEDNLFSYVVQGNKNKKFAVPLWEGGLSHDTAALLLSTFKRIVNKQQISGGSAVQVSAFGINGYERDGGLRFVQDPDNKANILYAEIEMPFDKSFSLNIKNADGTTSKQKVSLDYNKYCFENGHLRPTGNALQKGTKEWKKYQSYTYKEVNGELVPCKYNDPEAKVYKPLIEEDYQDILSILAYRIPSENSYSMLNCQIKRFTSKMAGGTIKVPPQGTTIAGFDFDIDKLYFMQREYHNQFSQSSYVESKFSEDDKHEIWEKIYVGSAELRRALERARDEAEDKDSTLYYIKTLKNGRQVRKHYTTLNSYYDQADGESITGKSKRDIFAEKAQQLGIEPTQNIIKEDRVRTDTYDFTKTPENNSRASRNNLLISIIQERLMDPETMKSRYTPGGFDDAKRSARLLRELRFGNLAGIIRDNNIDLGTLRKRQDPDTDPEPNYSATDPYTILVYNQQNQIAAKLIGIFANQNTHNAFVSCMDKFELLESIDFCGHRNMKDLLHKDPDEAYAINLNVAQFLSASVDAVKDPVLNFMNLNTITADSAALLARLGYNMEEIGLFLSQPVIVDICQESFNTERNIKSVIADMQRKLGGYTSADKSISLTSNDLALGIVNERLSKEKGEDHDKFLKDNAKMQLAVLNMFSKVLTASQDVSDFVTNTKFTASNAVGSTFGSLYAQQLRVNNYLDRFNPKGSNPISYDIVVSETAGKAGVMSTPIDNKEDLVTMSSKDYLHYVRYNPFAYEQAMYDTNRKALKLFAKYFPYETELYKRVRGRMNELSRMGALNEDEINAIHSNLPVAMLARQTASEFHGESLHRVLDEDEGVYKKTNVTNRTYYREDFAGDLQDLLAKDDILRSLAIFKFMIPNEDTTVVGRDPNTGFYITKPTYSISLQDVGGMSSDTKEEIKESWDYLMEVDDDGYFKNPKYAELGKDLFMYCFYQLGFEFSPISFMHLAPTAVKQYLKVERETSVPLNDFEEGKIDWDNPNSDDVIVWSANVEGSMERLAADFDVDRSLQGELQGKTYRLADVLLHGSVVNLVNAAISHPELNFKIDRKLTQREFDLFSFESLGRDVPTNIYFSKSTLNSVSDESKAAVSYGRERTYTQFLDDIQQGKEKDFDVEDFAKQWILNHLDNAKFVFDLNKGSKRLREVLDTQAKQSLSAHRDHITFDVSGFINNNEKDSKILRSFVKVNQSSGMITSAKWTPVIIYNNSYYMAQSNNALGFNVNQSMQMTYVKVAPMGTKRSFKYDNTKEIKPSMRYQAYLGETDEDLSHAEYIRQVSPAKVETKVEEEGKEEKEENTPIIPTPEANGSQVSLENRDPSDIQNALEAIKQQAEEKGYDTSKADEALDKLLNEDLRNQVLNEDDPLNDDTFNTVEDIILDTLGRNAWRKVDEDLKEALVSAVFAFNKNPKYLPTQSPVAEDPLAGGNDNVTFSPAVREYLRDNILKEFVAAIELRDKSAMMAEDVEAMKNNIAKYSDKDLADTIEALSRVYKENGVMLIDAKGNPMMRC